MDLVRRKNVKDSAFAVDPSERKHWDVLWDLSFI